MSDIDSAEKPSAHPSTKLRANGGGIEIIDVFPFMLSMSKHERSLFQQNQIFDYLFAPVNPLKESFILKMLKPA